MTELSQIVASAEIIVTCGTGGVGKTSVAASLGVVAARAGRRVVVITIDPARRLLDAIGLHDNKGNDIQQIPLDSAGELWVTMLDVRETFDSLVRDTSTSQQRADEVMQNSFYRSLSRSLSGTRDYMAAERLYNLQKDERFDLVIVDTPPSRNALDFLESPERLARFLKHPIVRFLVAPSRGGFRIANAAMQPVLKAISGIVGGDALTGAAAFLQAFDGMETEFSRRALLVAKILRSDATNFVIVTAPSPDALSEADHFVSELRRLNIRLEHVVANRMSPQFGTLTYESQSQLATTSTGDIATAHAVIAGLCQDAEINRASIAEFLQRTSTKYPEVSATYAEEMPADIHDLDSIEVLAQQLATGSSRK